MKARLTLLIAIIKFAFTRKGSNWNCFLCVQPSPLFLASPFCRCHHPQHKKGEKRENSSFAYSNKDSGFSHNHWISPLTPTDCFLCMHRSENKFESLAGAIRRIMREEILFILRLVGKPVEANFICYYFYENKKICLTNIAFKLY